MTSSRSASHWIGQLRAGDQVAAQHLWEGYPRTIAVWKTEGYSTDEIAAQIRRTPRTVERKLDLIRRRWTA